jgi:hypothetical protein
VYAAFETLLKPLLEYEDLKPEVFQLFREMGNIVLFMKDLSDLSDINDILHLIQAGPSCPGVVSRHMSARFTGAIFSRAPRLHDPHG